MKTHILKLLKTLRNTGASRQKMFTGLKTMNKFLTNRIFVSLNGSKEEKSISLITALIDM
jgi:hypothetical protein